LVQVGSNLVLAGDSELFGHPNQIGKRFCAHLLHDVGAMKFNRSLGGSEFAHEPLLITCGCAVCCVVAKTMLALAESLLRDPPRQKGTA
jgi:hypothetical protein